MWNHSIIEIKNTLMMAERFTEKQAQEFAVRVKDAIDNKESFTGTQEDEEILETYQQHLGLLNSFYSFLQTY
jgi:hypothetical protein